MAIERHIDRQLERFNVPIPSRTWLLDAAMKFDAEVEITYDCHGGKITITFDAEETSSFRRHPLPKTLQTIEHTVDRIRNAHARKPA